MIRADSTRRPRAGPAGALPRGGRGGPAGRSWRGGKTDVPAPALGLVPRRWLATLRCRCGHAGAGRAGSSGSGPPGGWQLVSARALCRADSRLRLGGRGAAGAGRPPAPGPAAHGRCLPDLTPGASGPWPGHARPQQPRRRVHVGREPQAAPPASPRQGPRRTPSLPPGPLSTSGGRSAEAPRLGLRLCRMPAPPRGSSAGPAGPRRTGGHGGARAPLLLGAAEPAW